MVTCYLDESAVNRHGHSPVAVVAGLLLNRENFFWIDGAWKNMISKHLPGRSFIHMKDFGKDGELAHLTAQARSDLFRDLVRVILRHKFVSLAGKLTHAQFESHFSFLSKKENQTIHGVCFLVTAVAMSKFADMHGCKYDIPFLLDDGCPDRKDIDRIHDFMVSNFQKSYHSHFGPLAWGDDEKVVPLQAADVIAWATRRRAANDSFSNGFEPLIDLFDEHHLEHEFEDPWMADIAASARAKLGR
jgi:hypothetical protein